TYPAVVPTTYVGSGCPARTSSRIRLTRSSVSAAGGEVVGMTLMIAVGPDRVTTLGRGARPPPPAHRTQLPTARISASVCPNRLPSQANPPGPSGWNGRTRGTSAAGDAGED